MIVSWKKASATELVSRWQGMHLRVYWDLNKTAWLVEVAAPSGQVLECSGRQVARIVGTWHSSAAAINAVDTAMDHVIRRAIVARPVHASKRGHEEVFVHRPFGRSRKAATRVN